MKRFVYEPGRIGGFQVFDLKHGHRVVAFCDERDDAELIVRLLNERYGDEAAPAPGT